AEEFDTFGSALAAGDFNGDGYVDLAVGVPGEDTSGVSGAGVVQVFYSSKGRLSSAGDQIWSQGSSGVEGALEVSDGFGYALAAGNFDGDTYDDLAVGVPREDKGDDIDTGAVNVLYGSSSGLTAMGNQIFDQDDFAFGTAEPGDLFGSALAVGYFDADAYADLAIGVPFEDWGTTVNTGALNVLYGTSSGLSESGGQMWSQNDAGDTREAFDEFGHALAVGDFDDNGYDDLAIGAPGETVGSYSSAGAVSVMYSQSTGLGVSPDFWYQDGTYIRDDAESGDHFGYALAAGDFDGNGYADLAVGVPDEHIDFVGDAGAVNVLYGQWNGLSVDFGSQFWHQDILEGTAEEEDNFGRSLAAGDFNGDGRDDLAVGVPYEDISDAGDAGAVNVIYGFGGGLGASHQYWHQDTSGVPGDAEEGDVFGLALVAMPTVKHQVFLPLVLRGL
ncbi:MAG: hypothetical protein PVI63_04005, partial [Anaerolineae bacterium]